jgi:hypothetical protein
VTTNLRPTSGKIQTRHRALQALVYGRVVVTGPDPGIGNRRIEDAPVDPAGLAQRVAGSSSTHVGGVGRCG